MKDIKDARKEMRRMWLSVGGGVLVVVILEILSLLPGFVYGFV